MNDGSKKIVISGGMIPGGQISLKTYLMDLDALDTWTDGPNLPQARFAGAVVPFRNTFLIVGGGRNAFYYDDILEYDVDDHVWITRPETLDLGRNGPTAFLVPDSAVDCN